MHEVGIMQSALDMAIERAQQEQAKQIYRIGLCVGALTNVVPESLEFAFEALTEDTIAKGAKLEVQWVPIACRCASCEREFAASEYDYQCPECRSWETTVIRGNELYLSFVEVG